MVMIPRVFAALGSGYNFLIGSRVGYLLADLSQYVIDGKAAAETAASVARADFDRETAQVGLGEEREKRQAAE